VASEVGPKRSSNTWKEADILDSGESLLSWKSPKGPHAERNARAADMLSRACNACAAGIGHIEAALKDGLA
jgi:hypothetical protein